jgi:hypothetical protein
VASELFPLDRFGVLVPAERLTGLDGVPVAAWRKSRCCWPSRNGPPELQLGLELCRLTGFAPAVYHRTVESIRASVDLVLEGGYILCMPSSCVRAPAGIRWVRWSTRPPTTLGR